MEAVGLKEEHKPASGEMPVTLEELAKLTGFPIDFIKRELLLADEGDLSVEDLREKVLHYLNSEF
jgi:hypothetical protein